MVGTWLFLYRAEIAQFLTEVLGIEIVEAGSCRKRHLAKIELSVYHIEVASQFGKSLGQTACGIQHLLKAVGLGDWQVGEYIVRCGYGVFGMEVPVGIIDSTLHGVGIAVVANPYICGLAVESPYLIVGYGC